MVAVLHRHHPPAPCAKLADHRDRQRRLPRFLVADDGEGGRGQVTGVVHAAEVPLQEAGVHHLRSEGVGEGAGLQPPLGERAVERGQHTERIDPAQGMESPRGARTRQGRPAAFPPRIHKLTKRVGPHPRHVDRQHQHRVMATPHGAGQSGVDSPQRSQERTAVGQRLQLHRTGDLGMVDDGHHVVTHTPQPFGRDPPEGRPVEPGKRLGRPEAAAAAPGKDRSEKLHPVTPQAR